MVVVIGFLLALITSDSASQISGGKDCMVVVWGAQAVAGGPPLSRKRNRIFCCRGQSNTVHVSIFLSRNVLAEIF